MSKKIVSIMQDYGPDQDYELLSSRMKRFLAMYPPKEGFQMIVTHRDYLEIRPKVAELFAKAIELGRKPEEMGLPAEVPGIVVFEAKLLDPEGRTLFTASSLRPIQSYKDWEKGETAARQRLVAAAGFHGTLLDEDEAEDMKDQKLEAKPAAASDMDKAKAEEATKPKPTRRGKRGGKKAESEKDSGDGIPPAMLAQIDHLAKLKNRQVEAPKTLEEAKSLLKELLAA